MSSVHNYRVSKPAQRTSTCDMCRSRHQKCGGEQPQCSNCKLRAINCSYSGAKTRVPETSRSPGSTFALPSSRPSISDADYDRLYAEIFGDIVRRLNLDKGGRSGSHEDALLDARPGNASLPMFHREVSSIVREQVSHDSWLPTSQSDANLINESALERSPDHIRKILRDSLPSQEVSRHLLDMFFDYQDSIFYVCNREEAQAQLALMYEEPAGVSISWFCQMFLIFAVGVQFDDVYDTDGTTYHEIGQKYIDDAIDENPQSTIWIIRAMLLLCLFQPPTKWNSVWMHLDTAIRGAQRFQLDVGHNLLKELSDNEYREWRRLWLTIISFDRWVAIFLGRLPRVKESISRDPILKDPNFRFTLTDTIQNNITTLAIISGDILRDMYFSEQPSLNTCRQYKTELKKWTSSLPNPLQQYIQSGEFPKFPKDQAESTVSFEAGGLGDSSDTVLVEFIFHAPRGVDVSHKAILIEGVENGDVSIDSASRLINNATTMLGSSSAPRKSFMPVFFLINAAHIMILAAVWKLKQNRGGYGMQGPYDQPRELAAIDASIQILEFCGHRNPFARRYSISIKDLQRQLVSGLSAKPSPGLGSGPPLSSMSSSASVTDSDPAAESPYFQNLRVSVEQSGSAPTIAALRPSFGAQTSYTSESPLNISLEGWSPGRLRTLSPGDEDLYVEFAVDDITEISWNDSLWNHLSIQPKQKNLTLALVVSHSQRIPDYSFDIIIIGKGRGLIILFYGLPRVNKTLTAEALSEHLRRPLYTVDLSSDTAKLEKQLSLHFELADHWNALLLLDEADMFLRKRDTDYTHNPLVSVFLRKDFDRGIQSRIHLALRYGPLGAWNTFLQNAITAGGKADHSDENLDDPAKHELHGRQIRNVVRSPTASHLASSFYCRISTPPASSISASSLSSLLPSDSTATRVSAALTQGPELGYYIDKHLAALLVDY
ncbi:Uncharacterized protein BP5553_08850 [Venustampulla echinocandica]|uniref:Zn(2)-C6 fungal-type domain-containing protein n=1 Tax=Venustampulla echinocandica TaxID=2656787 RepID=A0A370TD87_9HELO|nr:Uncharacterized protein BP5553_08850 [Venustampulla echinocandica]RDL32394.1 Uncharacterized protein BP5553_08850 [Venustampulla echinocandica]